MAKKTAETAEARKLLERLVQEAGAEKYDYGGKTYRVHPAALIFPLVEGTRFEELVANVKAGGVHEPITLLKGKILDGRNRLRAAIAAKVKVQFKELPPETSALEFVIRKNLQRRDLTPSQRAMAAQSLSVLSALSDEEMDSEGGAGLPAAPGAAPAKAGVPAPPGFAGPGERVPDRPSAEAGSGGAGAPKPPGGKKPGGPGQQRPAEPARSRDPGDLHGGGGENFKPQQAGAAVQKIDRDEAAALAGVSPRSMQRLQHVARAAPEYEELIKDDLASLKEAADPSVTDVAQDIRKAAVKLLRSAEAANLREAVKAALEKSGDQPKKRSSAKSSPGKRGKAMKLIGDLDADLDHTSLPKLLEPTALVARAAEPVSPERERAPAIEIYSPPELVAIARTLMGAIELDPASSPEAQKEVEASEWFGPSDDGVGQIWNGKVYCFPPLNQLARFADRLKLSFLSDTVKEAVFLAPSDTGDGWAHDLLGIPALTLQAHCKRDPVLETEPPGRGKRRGKWRPPMGLTVYVFGVEPTDTAVDHLSTWGYVFGVRR